MKKLLFLFVYLAIPAQVFAGNISFKLPELSYSYSSLEPYINEETMYVHYNKHHKAFVDKLNQEFEKDSSINEKNTKHILGNVSKYSDTIRNNIGGFWNHSFFWQVMTPDKNKNVIPAELDEVITKEFSSIEEFKKRFEDAGINHFGSGWVWLIVNEKGKLEITTTANQDNPLMDTAKVKGIPILGNDIWEHAYYLKYQNRKSEYVKNWWYVVNWEKVLENYKLAIKN